MVKADPRLTPLLQIEIQLRQLVVVEDAGEFARQATALPDIVAEYGSLAVVDPDVGLATELEDLRAFDHRDRLSELAAACTERIQAITGEV